MRQVSTLTVAQAFSACGTITLVAFGGIIGARLAPTPALATLPWSLSIVGVALASLPAALLMQRFGRRPVFVGSALLGAVGALACALAIAAESFLAFCLTGLLLGANSAVVQQYRFAAVESVPRSDAARAVATVMLGTLAAALVGPALGERVKDLGGWPEYTGSFVVLAALLLCAAWVLARLPVSAPVASERRDAGRTARGLLRVADYRLALLGALASYAVMSFIMTATPISMHVHDGFDGHATAGVITAHLLGMYLPSLATPWLTARLGVRGMMLAGLAANFACIGIVAAVGQGFAHYMVALVLLGVGWNLLFVGATAVLATTHSAEERFRAQGFNDLVVFGFQAIASLLAGFALETVGWTALNLATLPLLLVTAWMVLRRGEVAPTR